jgi:hypothetical protein
MACEIAALRHSDFRYILHKFVHWFISVAGFSLNVAATITALGE